MQQPNPQKTMKAFENLFDKANCQLHHKDGHTKIYHQVSLKELVRRHFQRTRSEASIPPDLGLGADRQTKDQVLVDGNGRFGCDWGSVEIKKGLMFCYEIQVSSVKQEEEEALYDKSAETDGYLGGKMNLIEAINDESETLVIDRDSDSSEKKSSDIKIVFKLSFEVSTKLSFSENVGR